MLKKILTGFPIFIIMVLMADVLLQLSYKAVKKKFTWESIEKHEIFKMGYLKPVNDERYVIPDLTKKNEDVQFEGFGFRVGKNKPSKNHDNILFLGDSVPFGFGAKAFHAIPSLFSEIMEKKTGNEIFVINAALPSYSLNQSVYRYLYEIKGEFPVSIIVLQTYDPAENFYILKNNWDVTRNWFTGAARSDLGIINKFTSGKYKYSSLFYLYWRFSGQYFTSIYNTTKYDKSDVERYKKSIISSLNLLYDNAKEVDHLIFLPITRPKNIMAYLSDQEKLPIELLNGLLQQFANEKSNVHFLDSRLLFQSYDDNKIFIDNCCHLSYEGAKLQSEYIADFILNL